MVQHIFKFLIFVDTVENQAVRMISHHGPYQLFFFLLIVLMKGNVQHIGGFLCPFFNSVNHFGEILIPQIHYNGAYHPAFPHYQAASHQIGLISQLLRRIQDPLSRFLTNASCSVKRPCYGRPRYSANSCQILGCYPIAASSFRIVVLNSTTLFSGYSILYTCTLTIIILIQRELSMGFSIKIQKRFKTRNNLGSICPGRRSMLL